MNSSQRMRVLRSLLPAAAVVLAACATPQQIAPGTSESDVRSRFGRPDGEHVLPTSGLRRLEYATGPHEQLAWMVDLDAAGRVTQVRQVRTLENFWRVRPGVDDMAAVKREFGTPYRVQYYRLSDLTAWMYPHQVAGNFNQMMGVLFDRKGVVVRTEDGPDPRFEGSDDRTD